MRGAKIVAAALIAVGSVGGVAWAQDEPVPAPETPAADLPKAEELFAKNVEASGGEAAIRATTSRLVLGRLDAPGGRKAKVTIATAAPDKVRVTQMFIPDGDVEQGYNGTTGWRNDFGKVTIVTAPEELNALKESAAFYRDLDYKTFYTEAETVEKLEWEGKSAYKVRYVTATGAKGFQFFDADSGLMYGNVSIKDMPEGSRETTTGPSAMASRRRSG